MLINALIVNLRKYHGLDNADLIIFAGIIIIVIISISISISISIMITVTYRDICWSKRCYD